MGVTRLVNKEKYRHFSFRQKGILGLMKIEIILEASLATTKLMTFTTKFMTYTTKSMTYDNVYIL